MHVDVEGSPTGFELLVFDRDGTEVPEDGGLASETVLAKLPGDPVAPVTDVMLLSHGWNNDVEDAKVAYSNWIRAVEGIVGRHPDAGMRPLIVGLHWPSKAWSTDEPDPSGSGPVNLTDEDRERFVAEYNERLGPSAEIADSVRTILAPGRFRPDAERVPSAVNSAFDVLHSAVPAAADREHWNTHAAFVDVKGFAGSRLFAAPDRDRHEGWGWDLLRQFSFWTMKGRAFTFGTTGAARFLQQLRAKAPDAHFHLMGHSFGCIVVTAAASSLAPRNQHVDSLFLSQGALSLWSYASLNPFLEKPGQFHDILADEVVTGGIVATTAADDFAIGRYYPLGASFQPDLLYVIKPDPDPDFCPRFGGLGQWGIKGEGAQALTATTELPTYLFEPGRIYNLDCTSVMTEQHGPAGAHSYIAKPGVADAYWQNVLVSRGS